MSTNHASVRAKTGKLRLEGRYRRRHNRSNGVLPRAATECVIELQSNSRKPTLRHGAALLMVNTLFTSKGAQRGLGWPWIANDFLVTVTLFLWTIWQYREAVPWLAARAKMRHTRQRIPALRLPSNGPTASWLPNNVLCLSDGGKHSLPFWRLCVYFPSFTFLGLSHR